jgi:hypothetical protein
MALASKKAIAMEKHGANVRICTWPKYRIQRRHLRAFRSGGGPVPWQRSVGWFYDLRSGLVAAAALQMVETWIL